MAKRKSKKRFHKQMRAACTTDMWKQLQELKVLQGISKAEIMRRAVQEYYDKYGF